MKKALALIMAIAMIASMAVVSMAATQIGSSATATKPIIQIERNLWTYTADGGFAVANNTKVEFGKTVYVFLVNDFEEHVTNADAVKGLTVSAKWEKGGEYVADVEIVKVGKAGQGPGYCVAIETTGSSMTDVSVIGEVAVKGQSYYEVAGTDGKLVGEKKKVDFKFDVELDLAYTPGEVAATINAGAKKLYNFENSGLEKATVNFGELSAEANVKGMKKVLFAWNDDVNEEIADTYVDADLVFINCEAAFRRTATVTVDATDYPYFYEVVDGALVAMDAEYDDWTEEFTFKTRTLGNYVLSDIELVVEEVAVANPSTGAAA